MVLKGSKSPPSLLLHLAGNRTKRHLQSRLGNTCHSHAMIVKASETALQSKVRKKKRGKKERENCPKTYQTSSSPVSEHHTLHVRETSEELVACEV